MRDIKEFQILDINAVSKGYSIFDLIKNAGNQFYSVFGGPKE